MSTQISMTAGSDGLRSSLRAAAQLMQARRRRRASRRTIKTLHGLTDHQLKDIGLLRSEINWQFGR